jgi:ureidoacrylate peracid hydrolase
MQNDFCSENGHYDKCGIDFRPIKRIIPSLSGLINNARKFGISIVYVQHTQLSNGAYLSPSVIASMLRRWRDESKLLYTLEGTWGHQIIDEIRPKETDLIVRKHRASAFEGTDLDLILRSLDKKAIILTGVLTERCVEATARDGVLKDYYVVIVEDCIATSSPTLHSAQLEIMKHIYHFVVPSNELVSLWKRPTSGG